MHSIYWHALCIFPSCYITRLRSLLLLGHSTSVKFVSTKEMMLSPIVRGPRTILCVAGRAMVGHLASTTAAVPESSVRAKDEIPGTAQHKLT